MPQPTLALKNTLKCWPRLSPTLRQRWIWLAPLGVVAAALDLATGFMLVQVASQWTTGGGPALTSGGNAGPELLALLIIAKTVLRVVETRRREVCVEASVTELSSRALRHWLRAPLARQLTASPTRRFEDVQAIARDVAREGVQSIVLFWSEGLVVLGMAALLFATAPGATLAVMLGFGLVAAGGLRLAHKRHGESGAELHESRVALSALVHGCLAAAQEIKLGAHDAFFTRYFSRCRDAVGAKMVTMETWRQAPLFINEAIFLLGVVALLAMATISGAATPTVLVFFYAGLRLLPAGNRLVYRLLALRVAEPAAERLLALIDGDSTAPETSDKATSSASRLELDKVDFTYPEGSSPALRRATITLCAGERVALVGPSGGGKSTLLLFCAGLLAPDSGEVRVDGCPLGVDDRAWQGRLGYVGQQTVLLEGTMRENIALGQNAELVDATALAEALAITGLDQIAAAWPEGVATALTENGGNLSGGQRQRVAIARELYRRPEWLLLDEATAFLDQPSEQALVTALARRRPGLTTIFVTHRLATARAADRVVFVRDGRVEACGPFDELAATHAEFRDFLAAARAA